MTVKEKIERLKIEVTYMMAMKLFAKAIVRKEIKL